MPRKKLKWPNSALCLVLGLCLIPTLAFSRAYQVDIIVFKNIETSTAAEPLSPSWTDRDFSGVVELSPSMLLPTEKSQLQNALLALKKSQPYQVLFSQSFVSDFKQGHKKTFRISSDEHYVWPPLSLDENNLPADPLSSNTYPVVDGKISFTLGYYFDIDVKLQVLQQQEATSPPLAYHIEQSLRSGSKKLLYLDNPHYGVLLYLSPAGSTYVD